MPTNLDEIIGTCRFCRKSLGESPPPACADCVGIEKRRTTKSKELDPYKRVWNSVEDEEAALLTWTKNGTLFVPTLEELAKRHMSTGTGLADVPDRLLNAVIDAAEECPG